MLQDDRAYSEMGSYIPPYSTEFGYDMDRDQPLFPADSQGFSSPVDGKPKIFLMGLRKSGKSSIQRVVFHKMAPNDTPYLESTHRIEKNDVSDCSFIKFQIWDFPGQFNFCDVLFQPELIFKASCAVIFVIDAQDDYHEAVNELHKILKKALHSNMNIKFDVFIHKVDCLNDDQKIDIQRDISQRVMSAAEDTYCDSGASNLYIGFHLTTIYDHSIFEAFSKVVQRLIPCLDAFEELLDIFITNSMVDKAFLFDVSSKIYLATDSSVVDMPTYELCCDMIDVVVDVAAIYTPHSDLVDPPFSAQTGATIMLNNDTVLYLRGINQYMALACLMHEESLEKMGLIEYNFQIIKDGLQRLLEVSQQRVQDEHVTLLAQQQQQRQRLLDGMHDNDRGAGNFSDIDCEVVDEEEEDDDEDVGRLALGPTAPRVRKQHFDRRLGNSG
ncbi:Ras- GTP-binding protein D [Clonorchis sinensis]|uniref:Ras- GTP-binding protein D n=2 Tax=Opisthorchiidae TaxID=6196 RepID=A0A8T1N1Z3_CLOSI|nr:Ras- GTP-binding protein D [Clonorchis sinensis]